MLKLHLEMCVEIALELCIQKPLSKKKIKIFKITKTVEEIKPPTERRRSLTCFERNNFEQNLSSSTPRQSINNDNDTSNNTYSLNLATLDVTPNPKNARNSFEHLLNNPISLGTPEIQNENQSLNPSSSSKKKNPTLNSDVVLSFSNKIEKSRRKSEYSQKLENDVRRSSLLESFAKKSNEVEKENCVKNNGGVGASIYFFSFNFLVF